MGRGKDGGLPSFFFFLTRELRQKGASGVRGRAEPASGFLRARNPCCSTLNPRRASSPPSPSLGRRHPSAGQRRSRDAGGGGVALQSLLRLPQPPLRFSVTRGAAGETGPAALLAPPAGSGHRRSRPPRRATGLALFVWLPGLSALGASALGPGRDG